MIQSLTRKEVDTIQRYTSSMVSMWPLLSNVVNHSDPGTRIAGTRFMLSTASDKQMVPMQFLLCKLLELYPEHRNDYIVCSQLPADITKLDMFATVMPVYMRGIDKNGSGFWSNRNHEMIFITALSLYNSMYKSSTIVLHRNTLITCIRAYRDQAKAASVEPAERTQQTVRGALAENALLESAVDRKRLAKDSQGTCWCCGSPKPRRVVCNVCGYKPRGGQS